MPNERELLKKLTESLNKQPDDKTNNEPKRNSQETIKQPPQDTIIPLRSLDEIMNDEDKTRKEQ